MLNDRQREEIMIYLKERPDKMPAYVRGLRMEARGRFGQFNYPEENWSWQLTQPYEELEINYRQCIEDLDLLKELALLDIQIGRKSTAFKELRAKANIRRRDAVDAKALLEVSPKQGGKTMSEIIDINGKKAIIIGPDKETGTIIARFMLFLKKVKHTLTDEHHYHFMLTWEEAQQIIDHMDNIPAKVPGTHDISAKVSEQLKVQGKTLVKIDKFSEEEQQHLKDKG